MEPGLKIIHWIDSSLFFLDLVISIFYSSLRDFPVSRSLHNLYE